MDESLCDPDYKYFNENEETVHQQLKETTIIEENVRLNSINKIKSIIEQQFAEEMKIKEKEVLDAHQKLTKARSLLDRLRACTVASYYAKSFIKPLGDNKTPLTGTSNHPAIKNVMRSAVTNVLSKNSSYSQPKLPANHSPSPDTASVSTEHTEKNDKSVTMDVDDDVSPCKSDISTPKPSSNSDTKLQLPQGPRRRICKTVIVGNISKYIPPEKREGLDKSTHKWMVYVRGTKDEPRIDQFIKKVWFFLHPSYRPHDLVEVNDSPFHLTRRGWGEFPLRVQLHFCDPRNKPVDILHNLKLDRSYTGLQTLGMETICEMQLDEASLNSNIDFTLINKDLNPEKPHCPRHLDFDKAGDQSITQTDIEDVESSSLVKMETLESDQSEVESILLNGDAVSLTNGHIEEEIQNENLKLRSTRKRRRTVECIVPVKRLNIENNMRISKESVYNSIKVEENNIETEIEIKVRDDAINEIKQSSNNCLNNNPTENGIHEVENNITICEDKTLPTTTKQSMLLEKCIGPFQKVYRRDKSNGPCINFLPNTKLKTVQSNSSDDKCHLQNTPFKINGNSNPTKLFILGNGTKIVQNGIASTTQPSTFPLTLSSVSKTPVRIMPNHKNITINLKSLQPSSIKKRSLSVDSSPQSRSQLPTVLLSPDKLKLLKSLPTSSGIKNDPVHVIINSKQKIPCKLKQTSQGFLVIADAKNPNQQKLTITKNAEVQPISVQNLQSILNGGKTIKNIVYPNKSELIKSPTNCMFATLTNLHGKQQLTFVNPKNKVYVPTATCMTSPSIQHVTNGINTDTPTKKSKPKDTSSIANAESIPFYQSIADKIHHKHLRNFNDALYVVVPKIPLLSDKVIPCPTSREQFIKWNVGKRKVAEWKHATLIHKVLGYLRTKSTILQNCEIPSKRYIVKWCALHGYSILKDLFMRTNEENHLESNLPSLDVSDTICDGSSLLQSLHQPDKFTRNFDEEDEIDVVSIDNIKQANEESKDEYIAMTTDCEMCAVKVVEDLSKQIGIKLHTSSAEKGIPSTNMVLLKALQLFISQLKSETLSAALTRPLYPNDCKLPSSIPIICTEDVACALQRTQQFDFLTDKYIGIKNCQLPSNSEQ